MKSIEMENKQFGRWTVIDRAENKKRKDIHWLCICSCGTRRVVSGYSLRIEDTKSCGCLNIEIARENIYLYPGFTGLVFTRAKIKPGQPKQEGVRLEYKIIIY